MTTHPTPKEQIKAVLDRLSQIKRFNIEATTKLSNPWSSEDGLDAVLTVTVAQGEGQWVKMADLEAAIQDILNMNS